MSIQPASNTTLLLERLQALAEPTRLQIVEKLAGGECCVCDLQDELDAGQSRLSFHLRKLKDAGILEDRREGRWAYYFLVPGVLGEVSRELEALGAGAPGCGCGTSASAPKGTDSIPGAISSGSALGVAAGSGRSCCGG